MEHRAPTGLSEPRPRAVRRWLIAWLVAATVTLAGPHSSQTADASDSPTASQVAAAPDRAAAPEGMIWIPAGPVRLGRDQVAEPVHDVEVAGFWIDRFEVTNAQFRAFIEAGGYTTEKWWHPHGWAWRVATKVTLPSAWTDPVCRGGGHKGNDAFPVLGVSWWEADAYCRWAGRRLPTEAEWEKAAKGGCEIWGDPERCDPADAPLGPWGEEISAPHANYWKSGDPYDNGPTPAGFYDGDTAKGYWTLDSRSPYGLYDVVGNAFEWTSSAAAEYPYVASDGRETPPGAMTECCRVARGGSWNNVTTALYTAKRVNLRPHERYNGLGFRTAKSE